MRGLVSIVALCALGCDQPAPAPAGSATSATTLPSATATVAAPVTKPPPLDVEALKKQLRCGGKGSGACAVLDGFRDCVAWSPATSGGDGRWLGEGVRVKDGKSSEELTLMRSKRVNSSDVAPGQLQAKVGIVPLPHDRAEVVEHAGKAIRAFERHDVALPTNPAIRYIKDRKDWPESFSAQSDGNQVHVESEGGAWLCGRADQRLFVVHRSLGGGPADGLYAALWPVTW